MRIQSTTSRPRPWPWPFSQPGSRTPFSEEREKAFWAGRSTGTVALLGSSASLSLRSAAEVMDHGPEMRLLSGPRQQLSDLHPIPRWRTLLFTQEARARGCCLSWWESEPQRAAETRSQGNRTSGFLSDFSLRALPPSLPRPGALLADQPSLSRILGTRPQP